MKKPVLPTLTLGRWRIKYRQIPYNDRFFFIEAKDCLCLGKWHETARFKKSSYKSQYIIFFLNSDQNARTLKFLENFEGRVKKYDEWLDWQASQGA